MVFATGCSVLQRREWKNAARVWSAGMGESKRVSGRTWLMAGLVGVLLAACGGGGETVSANLFEPKRVLSFGDELSVIDDSASVGNGRKYSVNAFKAQTAPGAPLVTDCVAYPIWNQLLAASYLLAFPQCKGVIETPTGIIYAKPRARVADVKAQIDQHLAVAGSFSRAELVTALAGMHDVLALYARFDGGNREALKLEAEALGVAMAGQVNRIADAGGRVIVSTIPDLSLSPFAIAEDAAKPGQDRIGLLRDLSDRFNAKLRTTIYNDGRRIGLVLLDVDMQAAAKTPALYGYKDAKQAVCLSTAVLPACATNTLRVDENGVGEDAGLWLWADATRPSVSVHKNLGSTAYSRSRINPF